MPDGMVREVELKSIVDDLDLRRRRVEEAGGRLVYAGRMEDRRYDRRSRRLTAEDAVLRLRTYRDGAGARAELGWKGATRYEDGYKVRDEIAARTGDPDHLAQILERLGYIVIQEIDREIFQYELGDAVVRFECYPQMDILVEVEGSEAAIEAAIRAIGLLREAFTTERLPDFVARYESRTGRQAAISDAELRGVRRHAISDA